MLDIKMNEITFKILPSPESNDSEVRILVDGNDISDRGLYPQRPLYTPRGRVSDHPFTAPSLF